MYLAHPMSIIGQMRTVGESAQCDSPLLGTPRSCSYEHAFDGRLNVMASAEGEALRQLALCEHWRGGTSTSMACRVAWDDRSNRGSVSLPNVECGCPAEGR